MALGCGCSTEPLLQQLLPGGSTGGGSSNGGVVLDDGADGGGSGSTGDSCVGSLAAVLTTNRYQLLGSQGPEGEATLHVLPLGGLPPFEYDWRVIDPAGDPADDLLDAWDRQAVRFSAAGGDGPFDVRCTVTDGRGCSNTGSLVLLVGTAIGLDLSTERVGVVAGGGMHGQAVVNLNPRGGTPPYEVSWTVTGPDGRVDNSLLDTTDPMAPVFVSGSQVGTYVLTATIVDAVGARYVESAVVVVGQDLGLDVTGDRARVLPDGGSSGLARLLATPIGGREPYTYDWEIIGPDGQQWNDLLWDSASRSPVFESSEETGHFLARCAVTDADGTVLLGSTSIEVGQQIAVDLTGNRLNLTPGPDGGSATLTADIRGGREPVDVAWSVTTSDGRETTDVLKTLADDQAVFTPSADAATYVVRVTAVDADGIWAADAVVLTVGGTLGAVVTADRVAVAASTAPAWGQTQLAVQVHGGVPPYEYAWTAKNPTGGAANDRLTDQDISDPIFTGGSNSGTYTVYCTVIDANGDVAMDAVSIAVGQPLNVDVSTDRQALIGGGGVSGQARIYSTTHGGVAPLVYSWQVYDPTGALATARLDSAILPSPTFTSALTTGTYRLALTVTDALGTVVSDSLELVVGSTGGGAAGQNLSVDVNTDHSTLAPNGSTATLTATVTGGVAPIVYLWAATNPSGALENARLNALDVPSVTFTSNATQGTYRLQCLVTDAVGNVFLDSIQIDVSNVLQLDLLADTTLLAPGGSTDLTASRVGGQPNFQYVWTARNESDALVGTFTGGGAGTGTVTQVNQPGDGTVNWTAPTALGTYRITCVTTDSEGQVFTDSIMLNVSDTFTLNVSASVSQVGPGGGVTLTADRTGGSANFNYDWTCLNSAGGSVGGFTADPQNGQADDVTNTWTAPAGLGTYRIICVATDADGNTFTDSVHVDVVDPFLLDVTASVSHVRPGGGVTLTANRTGGSANFNYDWTCLNSAGGSVGGFTTDPQNGQADDVTNTWTAPAGLGTYRITCVATDADGSTFTDSVNVVVTDAFLLDVTASPVHVAPGAAVSLAANRTGGSANFTYVWSCLNQAGNPAGAFTTGSTGPGAATHVGADDVTNTWTAPGAAAGTLGTYRLTCTATDADSATFTDSVEVVVEAPFSLDLRADKIHVSPGASTDLTANRTGGETTFTYVWTAVDSAGNPDGAFTNGSTGAGAATQAGVADDAANTWTAPAAAVGVDDSYTINCIATDARGTTFVDSIEVVVGPADSVAVNLTADAVFVAPGGAVELSAVHVGGESNYDYLWSALDSSDVAKGAFTTGSTGAGAAQQNDQAGDVTNTWTAPAAAAGTQDTYRIEVRITDDLGDIYRDTVHVIVRSLLSLNVTAREAFVAPSTAVALSANQTGGETTYSYTWEARNSAGALAGAFTTGSTGVGTAAQNAQAADVTNSWSVAATGAYTLQATVTDNTGQTFTDSTTVVVTNLEIFTLDVTADRTTLAHGETINLVGDSTGGTANFNYAWSALDEAGAAAGSFGAANQNGVAGDTTNTWAAPTGPGSEETYRIRCTVTDALGNTFTESVFVEVSSLAVQNLFLAPLAADTTSVLTARLLTGACAGADPGQLLAAVFIYPVHPRNVVIRIIDADNSITGGTARVTGFNARGQVISEVLAIGASGGGGSTTTGLTPFSVVTALSLFTFAGADAGVDQVSMGVGDKFGLTGPLDSVGDVLYVSEGGTVKTAGYTVVATDGQEGITFQDAPDGARNYTVVFRAR